MGTQYNGQAGNVSKQATLTLTSPGATNATPIVCTTSSAHGLNTGDTIDLAGVNGNTAANGRWVVTVLSTTTFSLNGSTGNGTYTSGGTVFPRINSPSTYTIPSDGDAQNASSVNVALEALGDRTAWLEKQVGLGIYEAVDTCATLVTGTLAPTAQLTVSITSGNTFFPVNASLTLPTSLAATMAVIPNDVVISTLQLTWAVTAGTPGTYTFASLYDSINGAAFGFIGGAYALAPGTSVANSATLVGVRTIPANSSGQYLVTPAFATTLNTGTPVVTMYEGFAFTQTLYRRV